MSKITSFLVFATISFSLALSSVATAGVLVTTPGTKTINNVIISKSGILTIEGRINPLTTIAAGLRTKVLLVNLNVYVLEVLTSQVGTNVSDSLNTSGTTVLHLTFLRAVEAEKVQASFRDGLVANGVNLNDEAIIKFLTAVNESGDAKDSGKMTMAFEKLSDGTEVISYESTNNTLKSISAPAGTGAKIISIWFGKSADSGLEKLKAALLAGLI